MISTTLIALPLLMALIVPSTAAEAATRNHKIKAAKRAAFAFDDAAPRVRIRADRYGGGLTALEFARWLRAHPQLVTDTPHMLNASSSTRLLNRAAKNFVHHDRDGRVSLEELADFVQPA